MITDFLPHVGCSFRFKVDFFIQFLDLEFRFIASAVVWDFFGAPTKILPPRYFLARYGPDYNPISNQWGEQRRCRMISDVKIWMYSGREKFANTVQLSHMRSLYLHERGDLVSLNVIHTCSLICYRQPFFNSEIAPRSNILQHRLSIRPVATGGMEGHCPPPRNHFAPLRFHRWKWHSHLTHYLLVDAQSIYEMPSVSRCLVLSCSA